MSSKTTFSLPLRLTQFSLVNQLFMLFLLDKKTKYNIKYFLKKQEPKIPYVKRARNWEKISSFVSPRQEEKKPQWNQSVTARFLIKHRATKFSGMKSFAQKIHRVPNLHAIYENMLKIQGINHFSKNSTFPTFTPKNPHFSPPRPTLATPTHIHTQLYLPNREI